MFRVPKKPISRGPPAWMATSSCERGWRGVRRRERRRPSRCRCRLAALVGAGSPRLAHCRRRRRWRARTHRQVGQVQPTAVHPTGWVALRHPGASLRVHNAAPLRRQLPVRQLSYARQAVVLSSLPSQGAAPGPPQSRAALSSLPSPLCAHRACRASSQSLSQHGALQRNRGWRTAFDAQPFRFRTRAPPHRRSRRPESGASGGLPWWR